jgi:hypothetical protein
MYAIPNEQKQITGGNTMPFEQYSEFNYNDLPQHTKYRFMEIEINEALKCLSLFYKNELNQYRKASDTIFNTLFPMTMRHDNITDEYFKATESTYFRRPNKNELIFYFLYKGQSYAKIRKFTGASPNTISKYRFQQPPNYYPIYQRWELDQLHAWNDIKKLLNLFNEELVHMND